MYLPYLESNQYLFVCAPVLRVGWIIYIVLLLTGREKGFLVEHQPAEYQSTKTNLSSAVVPISGDWETLVLVAALSGSDTSLGSRLVFSDPGEIELLSIPGRDGYWKWKPGSSSGY